MNSFVEIPRGLRIWSDRKRLNPMDLGMPVKMTFYGLGTGVLFILTILLHYNRQHIENEAHLLKHIQRQSFGSKFNTDKEDAYGRAWLEARPIVFKLKGLQLLMTLKHEQDIHEWLKNLPLATGKRIARIDLSHKKEGLQVKITFARAGSLKASRSKAQSTATTLEPKFDLKGIMFDEKGAWTAWINGKCFSKDQPQKGDIEVLQVTQKAVVIRHQGSRHKIAVYREGA